MGTLSFSTSSTHNWVFSLKLLLISTGVLFTAMALKLTVPIVSDFIVTEGPTIWSFLLTWLRPPYLYILLNCIILTIVASSKLQHHSPPHQAAANIPAEMRSEYAAAYGGPDAAAVLPPVQNPAPEPVEIPGIVRTDCNLDNGVVSYESYVYDARAPVKKTMSEGEITNGSFSDENVLTPSLQRTDASDLAFSNENEKPPVSARFGHRNAVKASPEGGGGKVAALGVAKPKRHDTLESTWKTITDGCAMPLTRHLKKSDTWDSQQQQQRRHAPLADLNGGGGGGTPSTPKLMKKAETFPERSKTSKENGSSPSSAGRMRKEPSLSQDELNRRVEAFIKKFNDEMRLQRQESLRQYQEMINRGAQ